MRAGFITVPTAVEIETATALFPAVEVVGTEVVGQSLVLEARRRFAEHLSRGLFRTALCVVGRAALIGNFVSDSIAADATVEAACLGRVQFRRIPRPRPSAPPSRPPSRPAPGRPNSPRKPDPKQKPCPIGQWTVGSDWYVWTYNQAQHLLLRRYCYQAHHAPQNKPFERVQPQAIDVTVRNVGYSAAPAIQVRYDPEHKTLNRNQASDGHAFAITSQPRPRMMELIQRDLRFLRGVRAGNLGQLERLGKSKWGIR